MASPSSFELFRSWRFLIVLTLVLVVMFITFIDLAVRRRTVRVSTTPSGTLPVECREQPAHHIGDGVSSHKSGLLPRVLTKKQLFKWSIQIPSQNRDLKHAVALLDTQCQRGNWVSGQFLERIGKTSKVQKVGNTPLLEAAKGGFVSAQGRVSLEWKRQQGNKFYETDFYVFPPDAIHFDVIFGAEYIFENKFLMVNEHAMLPLLQGNKNISPGEQQKIDDTKASTKVKKDTLEADRQQNESSQSNQGHHNQG